MKVLSARTIALLACLALAWGACGDDSDDGGAGGTGGSDADTGGTGGGGGGKGGTGGGGSASNCDEADAGFQACGGDPSGTWTMAMVCMPGADGHDEDCPGAELTFDFPKDIRFVFEGGTVETIGDGIPTMRLTAPVSCIEGAESCEEADELYQEWLNGSCSGTDEACTCEMVGDEFVLPENATYSVDGERMTFTDDEGESVHEFCVKGSTMTLRHLPGDGEESEGMLVFKRK